MGSEVDQTLNGGFELGTESSRDSQTAAKSIKRILVMDDQEEILGVVRSMLVHLGYEVETAAHGAAAVDLFGEARAEDRSFDAVILDLNVRGGMGGVEALKHLIEMDPDVKAVVSSGYSHDPIMDNHESYGFSSIIAKPFTLGQLEEVLRRLLGV